MSRPARATKRVFRLPHATGKNAYRETRETALGWELAFSYTVGMMTAQAPFRIYYSDGETVIRQAVESLEAAGLHVVKTFDLRSACASFTENTCPHHGTAPCDCQLAVLLIYGPDNPPICLILHSHRGRTELQWDEAPESRPNPAGQAFIVHVLNGSVDLPAHIDAEAYADVE